MNADSVAQLPSPPDLFVSLWSLRHRVAEDPAGTLSLLREWGVSTVEVAGCFSFTANELQWQLNANSMQVCSIVAPPIRDGRDLLFYKDWAKRYLDIFSAKTIVLQTLPMNFEGASEKGCANACNDISDLLLNLASDMQAQNVKLSYHCFPHDFKPIMGASFLNRLRQNGDMPKNLGLQLDTYWLRMANVEPSSYSKYVVHSVHLNERDQDGHSCVLGTDQSVCADYIRPLLERETPINWILENDSAIVKDARGDKLEIATLRQCVYTWNEFWRQTENRPLPPNTPEFPLTREQQLVGAATSAKFVAETMPDTNLYEAELNQALTEHLFGDDADLGEIAYNDERASYYVGKRTPQANHQPEGDFSPEGKLYSMVWPKAGPGKQLVHVVGGAGAGKSTFIRYFFQYFLPNRERIINGAEAGDDVDLIHRHLLDNHIFLYADLRRGFDRLWKTLGNGLARAAKKRGISLAICSGGEISENDVRNAISQLSRETDGGSRKWYISWILDNSDQLTDTEQKNLVQMIFDWIAEEPSSGMPISPVIDADKREIWRVIVPIRPETRRALEADWHPLRNRAVLLLDPIDHDLLMEKRSEFLCNAVSRSNKSTFVDLCEVRPSPGELPASRLSKRPHFDMVVSAEKASELATYLRVAHGAVDNTSDGSTMPEQARPIFDKLVNDSARRRLHLVRRVISSVVFQERMRLGQLSKFYFLESLIRDSDVVFDPDDPNNPLLNLYAIGSEEGKSDPFSTFVGIHAIWFLKQRHEWAETRIQMGRLGYPNRHLDACEDWLRNKEVLRNVAGRFHEEFAIADAHWELLHEPAYTDSMAVACATIWKSPDKARPTDSLRSENLLPRLDASAWFIEQVWEAERSLSWYRASDPDFCARCGEFLAFDKTRRGLKLPVVTNMVASAYLRRLNGLPFWLKPREALASV